MDNATIFLIANNTVLIAWILLAVAPKWKWTQIIIYSYVFPILLAITYGILMIKLNVFGETATGASFSSLEGVSLLFTNSDVVLIGWLHFLAFDLFVGSWEVRNAQKTGIPHLLVVPCLFLTLMAGPLGLLMYLVIRRFKTARFIVEEKR